MIERSDRIQAFVWPGFCMIERSARIQAFEWPGFCMIERSDRIHSDICMARFPCDRAIR